MQYRAIRSDELATWRQFQEYCFHVSPADFDPWIAHKFQLEHTRSLFTADGQMVVTCVNYPWEVYCDGARLGMGAIASVASLPENRRGGHVGQLMHRLIGEMKEQGIPLSSLFPFKQSFYRRYGWEVASAWVEHEIPVELLDHLRKYSGVIRRYPADGADWRQLAAIYDRWAPSRRGYIVRPGEHHWRNWVYSPMPQAKWLTAVYHPEAAAEPEGYLIYKFEEDDKGQRQFLLRELVALNPAAEQALWGFVANHDSQVKSVKVRKARTYPLWHLVENTDAVKSTLKSGWMLRLIDLKAAFEARPWPGAPDGAVTIAVTDEQAPWNEGTWRIAFEGGRATVKPAPAETAALSADVRTWAQIYAGFVRPDQAAALGALSGADSRSLALLDQAVGAREIFFFEYF